MKIRDSLRSTEWLREIQQVLRVSLAATALGVALNAFLTICGPVTVRALNAHVRLDGTFTGLRDGARLDPDGSVNVVVRHPTTP